MELPDHPDPGFTPTLAWGDPVPLVWQRTAPGLWLAWPPRQFNIPGESKPVLWTLDVGYPIEGVYRPDAEPGLVPPGTRQESGPGSPEPPVKWGDPAPSIWSRHNDGRSSVRLSDMKVSLPVGEVRFAKAQRTPDPVYYPWSAQGVALCDGLVGDAEYMGPPRTLPIVPIPEEKAWRRQAGRRWVLGTLEIEPSGTLFRDEPDLLPLTPPTQEEIDSAEEQYLAAGRSEGKILYLRLVEALARSEALMANVGDDDFARQVQRFMADNWIYRESDGAEIVFTSDGNFGWILAHLRRYGESYMMFEYNWAKADPAAQERIRLIFEEVGYCVV